MPAHGTRGGRLLSLSEREREVLALIAAGATDREIGDRLCLSWKTVKTYCRTIYQKTGVRNRVEATLWWLAEKEKRCQER